MRDLSDWGAGANILKGLIGLGVLSLPYATSQIGWLPSIVGMAVIAFMTVWGIFFAVMAKDLVDEGDKEHVCISDRKADNAKDLRVGAGQVTGLGFFDRIVWQVFGPAGQLVCSLSIATCQFVTAAAYISLVVRSVLSYYPDRNLYVVVLVAYGLVLLFLSAVRTLRGISVLSLIGLATYVLIFLALLATAVSGGRDSSAPASLMVKNEKPDFGRWFGISAFAFGAFNIAIVVHDDMRHPSHFFWVTSWAFAACWLFYSAFALLGYLVYGEYVKDIIYLSFPEGSFLRNASLLSICVILTLTYVLQMFPLFSSAEQLCGRNAHYLSVRAALVLSTCIFACMFPETTLCIEMAGAICAVISSFLLPPLVYLKLNPYAEVRHYAIGIMLIGLGCFGAWEAVRH